MTSRKTPANDRREAGALAGAPSGPSAHPDGPLFAAGQPGIANAKDAASPYPWDEPGELEPDAEAGTEPGPPTNLPASEEMFDPEATQSEAAGDDPPNGLDRLNENIEQLLETVDAVAADAAESRSRLEGLSRKAPQDPEVGNGGDEIEYRIRVHTADFHRWIEADRRRRRWCRGRSSPVSGP